MNLKTGGIVTIPSGFIAPQYPSWKNCNLSGAIHCKGRKNGGKSFTDFGQIFTNIAYYAYDDGEEGTAVIRLKADPENKIIELVFIDSGQKYDPLAKEDPDITLNARKRSIGGLGIFMTKQVMDEICGPRPAQIMVYNKMDLTEERPLDASGHDSVFVSAKTGQNVDELLRKIDRVLTGDLVQTTFAIPYDKGGITSVQMELYKTVRAEAEASQTIERSKFTAHVKPVESREEAEEFIAQIKAQYRDATHNVPAMVLGDQAQIQWASDDGEPQGTSGAPMVQLMTGEGLTNMVIVVTRYFGGIKLGTGGLVRAYSSSARLGIEAAGICSVCSVRRMTIRTDYTYLDRITKKAADSLEEAGSFVISDTVYADKVTFTILAQEEDADAVTSMLANLTSGTAEILEMESALERV